MMVALEERPVVVIKAWACLIWWRVGHGGRWESGE